MSSHDSQDLDLSNLAMKAGLELRVLLSEAASRRCLKKASNKDTICGRLIDMLATEMRRESLDMARKGSQFSVNVAPDTAPSPDLVKLQAIIEEFEGAPRVRICLRREIASQWRQEREARRQNALKIMLAQSHGAIMAGYLCPVSRICFFPPDCLDGKEIWTKSNDQPHYEVRTELYASESAVRPAPLIEKLKPFLETHETGLITCETPAEAVALTQVLNGEFSTSDNPRRFELGSYPNTGMAKSRLTHVRHAMRDDAVQFLVAARRFEKKFRPNWTLWIDLCRWTSPLKFTMRLQELCRLSPGKWFAEAVTFQVASKRHLGDQIILCDAVRQGAFGSPGLEDPTYRGCLDSRWARLMQLANVDTSAPQ